MRDVIVDRDCRGDSKDVELEAVDSIVAELCVEEDLFKSGGLVCDGCSSMHEPAIAEITLVDVLRVDSSCSEERVPLRVWVLGVDVNDVSCIIEGT